MAEAAAGMDADWQAVLFRRAVDRPVLPPAQRQFGHCQHQHLDEAAVGRHPLDLLGGEIRAVHRHDDGGAQPRVAVKPLGSQPVVDAAAEAGRQVLAEHDLGAVQYVADGEPGLLPVEDVALHADSVLPGGPGQAASPGGR